MNNRPRAAGGFLLVAAILAGFAFGVTKGDPLGWSLVGLAVGIGAAIGVWLWDRRRP